ncbi:MAG: CBS domain-containing protein [Nitrososphaerales archaeon]
MKVKDLMTKKVITIGLEHDALDAAKVMKNEQIASLVVMKDSKPYGIVTERDFLRRVCANNFQSKNTKLVDITSSPLITIDPNATVEDAVKVMVENKIRRIVVTEKDTVVGILTATDLAAYLIKTKRGAKQVLLALTRNAKSVGERYIFGT